MRKLRYYCHSAFLPVILLRDRFLSSKEKKKKKKKTHLFFMALVAELWFALLENK